MFLSHFLLLHLIFAALSAEARMPKTCVDVTPVKSKAIVNSRGKPLGPGTYAIEEDSSEFQFGSKTERAMALYYLDPSSKTFALRPIIVPQALVKNLSRFPCAPSATTSKTVESLQNIPERSSDFLRGFSILGINFLETEFSKVDEILGGGIPIKSYGDAKRSCHRSVEGTKLLVSGAPISHFKVQQIELMGKNISEGPETKNCAISRRIGDATAFENGLHIGSDKADVERMLGRGRDKMAGMPNFFPLSKHPQGFDFHVLLADGKRYLVDVDVLIDQNQKIESIGVSVVPD